ncbi:MAG: DUF2933 domain-containing protein, partial [Deinococcus sp.]
LAAVGIAIFAFVSPRAAVAALPLLALAVCPLSMGFMMWGMGGMNKGSQGSAKDGIQTLTVNSTGSTTNKLASQNACCAPDKSLSRDEQVIQLQGQLQDMRLQQQQLAAQLSTLELPERRPELASVSLAKPSN